MIAGETAGSNASFKKGVQIVWFARRLCCLGFMVDVIHRTHGKASNGSQSIVNVVELLEAATIRTVCLLGKGWYRGTMSAMC